MNEKNKVQYGELVYTTTSGITNVLRIRLFDTCRHEWCDQLIHRGKLYYRTDQDLYFVADGGKGYTVSELTKYKSVYFNGILIYNRPLYKRIFDLLKL